MTTQIALLLTELRAAAHGRTTLLTIISQLEAEWDLVEPTRRAPTEIRIEISDKGEFGESLS